MSKLKKSLTAAALVAAALASVDLASAHHSPGNPGGASAPGASDRTPGLADAVPLDRSCPYESRAVFRFGYFVGYRQVATC